MRPVPEYDAKTWLLKAMRETAHAMESLIWDVDDRILDRRPTPDEWSCKELLSHMSEMERRYIRRVLEACGSNKTQAAKVLGIDRRSLYRRLEDRAEGT